MSTPRKQCFFSNQILFSQGHTTTYPCCSPFSPISKKFLWPWTLTLAIQINYVLNIIIYFLHKNINEMVCSFFNHSLLERLLREKKCATNFGQSNHENKSIVIKNKWNKNLMIRETWKNVWNKKVSLVIGAILGV